MVILTGKGNLGRERSRGRSRGRRIWNAANWAGGRSEPVLGSPPRRELCDQNHIDHRIDGRSDDTVPRNGQEIHEGPIALSRGEDDNKFTAATKSRKPRGMEHGPQSWARKEGGDSRK